MWWHTVTHGRGSKEETGEWSGWLVPFTLPRNMVYPALLPLMRKPRLSVVRRSRFKWTRPFRWKTKSGFCTCAISFQTQSTNYPHFGGNYHLHCNGRRGNQWQENQNDMDTGDTGTIRSPSWFHRASDSSDSLMHKLCAVDCGKKVWWNVKWKEGRSRTMS
jgi:hypothetical protein